MSPDAKSNLARMREAIKKKQAEAAQAIEGKTLTPPATLPENHPMAPRPKKPKPPRSPQARDAAHAAKGRLPDGATATLTWNANRGVWVGMLAIPLGDGKIEVFRHQADGQFRCLSELDDKYRAHLAQPVATLPPEEPNP